MPRANAEPATPRGANGEILPPVASMHREDIPIPSKLGHPLPSLLSQQSDSINSFHTAQERHNSILGTRGQPLCPPRSWPP